MAEDDVQLLHPSLSEKENALQRATELQDDRTLSERDENLPLVESQYQELEWVKQGEGVETEELHRQRTEEPNQISKGQEVLERLHVETEAGKELHKPLPPAQQSEQEVRWQTEQIQAQVAAKSAEVAAARVQSNEDLAVALAQTMEKHKNQVEELQASLAATKKELDDVQEEKRQSDIKEQEQRDEIRRLQALLQETQEDGADARETKELLHTQLKESERRFAELAKSHEETEGQLRSLEKREREASESVLTLREELDQLQAELADTKKKGEERKHHLNTLSAKDSELQQQVDLLQAQAEERATSKKVMKADLQRMQVLSDSLNEQVDNLKRELDTRANKEDDLTQRITALQAELAEARSNADEQRQLASLDRQAAESNRLVQEATEKIAALEQELARASDRADCMQAANEENVAKRKMAETRQQELTEELVAVRQELSALERTKSTYEKQVNELQHQVARHESELAAEREANQAKALDAEQQAQELQRLQHTSQARELALKSDIEYLERNFDDVSQQLHTAMNAAHTMDRQLAEAERRITQATQAQADAEAKLCSAARKETEIESQLRCLEWDLALAVQRRETETKHQEKLQQELHKALQANNELVDEQKTRDLEIAALKTQLLAMKPPQPAAVEDEIPEPVVQDAPKQLAEAVFALEDVREEVETLKPQLEALRQEITLLLDERAKMQEAKEEIVRTKEQETTKLRQEVSKLKQKLASLEPSTPTRKKRDTKQTKQEEQLTGTDTSATTIPASRTTGYNEALAQDETREQIKTQLEEVVVAVKEVRKAQGANRAQEWCFLLLGVLVLVTSIACLFQMYTDRWPLIAT